MLLSELLVNEVATFQKDASMTMLPLAAHGAITAKKPVEGAFVGALKSIPTDIGIGVGGGLGASLGAILSGGSLGDAKNMLSGDFSNVSLAPLLATGAGALGGAVLGGLGGYSLGDYTIRKILGEEKYKEIFDLERERKVKDKDILT